MTREDAEVVGAHEGRSDNSTINQLRPSLLSTTLNRCECGRTGTSALEVHDTCSGIRDTRPPSRKRTCCRAGWCVTSIAGAVEQGSSDSGFELGGVPLHTRG